MLLLPLCLGLGACGSDDENNDKIDGSDSPTTNPLVGTWVQSVDSYEIRSGKIGSYPGVRTYTYTFENDGTYKWETYFIYSSDGEKWVTNTIYGDYFYDKDTKMLSLISKNGWGSSTYRINLSNNILIIIYNDGGIDTYSKK